MIIDSLQQWLHRCISIFRRPRLDRELDTELSAHIDLATEENLSRGMTAEEARRQALIGIGGTQQAKERHREARGLQALDIFFQDLRYAVRGLVKSPGFAIAAVLTLAMGIAVNATMFSMVSGFLLRRPPVRQPEDVVVVSSVSPAGGLYADTNLISVPNYEAWRAGNDVFDGVAAVDLNRTVNLTLKGQTQALPAAAISANYFSVLGVHPQLGRGFSEEETQPGRHRVVILSHELWARDFGADPTLIGRTIRLNREDYSLIGVMPANFRLLGLISQVWMPLEITAADETPAARNHRVLWLFARMKHGVTLEQARAELNTLGRRSQQDFPAIEKGWGVSARTLSDFLIYTFGIRSALIIAMIVVGFVLLIACANVAGLLLARAGVRRKELAIRMSLGAGRLRIIRQLLTEGLILALLGGGFGLLFSFWGIRVVRAHMVFNDAVRAVTFGLDWNVLLFALGISLLSALVCSLAPALTASRTDINTSLKGESRAASAGRSQSRLRTVLVTAEVAAALFLLIGTGLLLHAIFLMQHQDLGFQPERLLTAGLTLDNARYKNDAQKIVFVQKLTRLLEQIPGAESAAASSDLPAVWSNNVSVRIKGQPDLPADRLPTAYDVVVTTDYFQTAGVPLLRGRLFRPADDAAAPRVVLINDTFARRYFKNQDPLGKQVRVDLSGAPAEWSEVVGVVANVKTFSQALQADPQIYESFLQRPVSTFSLLIHTSADPNSLAPALRKSVADLDAELPLSQVSSMRSIIDLQLGGSVFFLEMLGTFALLALVLSGIGIYGLLAYSVGQRGHEIAIRMALGASAHEVRRMVLREGISMTVIGAGVGLVMALPLPRVFQSMLDGLPTGDARAYVIVPVAILVVATLATYIPARRASSTDPMRALRGE